MVLNKEGWILTAAHILDLLKKLSKARDDYAALAPKEKAIRENPGLKSSAKKKQLRKLLHNKSLLTHYSPWWGLPGASMVEGHGLGLVDLAVCRLEPFDPKWVSNYPVLKDPSRGLDPGTSLCRTGFPFHQIEPQFDETKETFLLPKGSLPLPLFPIEGIFTRTIGIQSPDWSGAYPLQLLETSSPGLKGQSGGPIFDVNGTVWAIQSRTKRLFARGCPIDMAWPGVSR